MTIKEKQDEIVKKFEGLKTWMEKYAYLIKLGKNLPPIDIKYKIEENIIRGCQVKTWFHSEIKDGKVFYAIDSGSTIIRGLISLLLRVLSEERPEDIKNTNLYFINSEGLKENFSPLRANSLWKLVNRIKEDAVAYANEERINK